MGHSPAQSATLDLISFAADRRSELEGWDDTYRPAVTDALNQPFPAEALMEALRVGVQVSWEETTGEEIGLVDQRFFINDMRPAVAQTVPALAGDPRDHQIERITRWFSTATVGYVADRSSDGGRKTWWTMKDDAVRDVHIVLHGDSTDVRQAFRVPTDPPALLQYPGQPIGPLEAWINCRCVLSIS